MIQLIFVLLGITTFVTGYFSPVSDIAENLFNISAISLSLLYALFGFIVLQTKNFKTQTFETLNFCKVFSIALAGWGISIIYLGVIFKIYFLPYDMILLKIGLILLIISVLHLFFVFKANQKLKIFFKYTLPHSAVAFLVGIWFYSITPHQILSFYIKDKHQKQQIIKLYDRWQQKKTPLTKDDFFLTYYIYLSKQRSHASNKNNN